MALCLASVMQAIEKLSASIFTRILTSGCYWARHSFLFFLTETLDRDVYVAWWTAAWVTQNITFTMRAVIVFAFLTVLAAGVRKDHRRKLWFIKSAAVAVVFGHYILCVAEIAVRTCPAIESKYFLGCLSSITLFFITFPMTPVSWRRHLLFLFFLVIILIVEFLDPPLDAPKMERVMTLVAVPKCTSLIYRIMADYTFLSSFWECFHKVCALFCQISKLLQEVLVVVLNWCLVLSSLHLIFCIYVDIFNLFIPILVGILRSVP